MKSFGSTRPTVAWWRELVGGSLNSPQSSLFSALSKERGLAKVGSHEVPANIRSNKNLIQWEAGTYDPDPVVTLKVLIVDDEPEALELYSDTFVNYSIEAVVFDNAEDSLRYLENQPVDAIISDIFMPGLDGIEFFKELKKSKNFPGIFVMLSGRWSEELEYLLDEGVSMIFHKPFAPEGLALYLIQEHEKRGKEKKGA